MIVIRSGGINQSLDVDCTRINSRNPTEFAVTDCGRTTI